MFITLMLIVIAALAAMAILYAQHDVTFPKREGVGGYALPAGAAVLAMFLVWVLGRYLGGVPNVYAETETSIEFALAYGSTLLSTGAWILIAGVVALLSVASYNMYRHGKAWM